MPFLDTLDGRNEGRSTEARDVNNALQAVHDFGDELHRDQSMHRFLQRYKFIGVRLCPLALQVEILGVCSVTLLCSATTSEGSTGRAAIPSF